MLKLNLPSIQQIYDDIFEQGFCVYDDVIATDMMDDIRTYWCQHFLSKRQVRNLVGSNLRLGSQNFEGVNRSKQSYLFRSFDFLWNPPTHAATREIALGIHQTLNGRRGFEFTPERVGTYVVTQWYPPGRGFLPAHYDRHQVFPELLFLIPITFKGLDYEGGGLFIKNKKNQKVVVDDLMKPGSIVVYSKELEHGVDLITVKSDSQIGRISLYSVPAYFKTRADDPAYLQWLEETHFRIRNQLSQWFS